MADKKLKKKTENELDDEIREAENDEAKHKISLSKDSLQAQRRSFSGIEGSYLEKHAIGMAGSRGLMANIAPNLTMKFLKSNAMFVSDIKASLTMTDQQLVEYYKNYDKVKQESNQRIDNIVNTAVGIRDAKLNLKNAKLEREKLLLNHEKAERKETQRELKEAQAKLDKKDKTEASQPSQPESTKPALTIPSLSRFDKVLSGNSNTSYSGITKDGYSFDK